MLNALVNRGPLICLDIDFGERSSRYIRSRLSRFKAVETKVAVCVEMTMCRLASGRVTGEECGCTALRPVHGAATVALSDTRLGEKTRVFNSPPAIVSLE